MLYSSASSPGFIPISSSYPSLAFIHFKPYLRLSGRLLSSVQIVFVASPLRTRSLLTSFFCLAPDIKRLPRPLPLRFIIRLLGEILVRTLRSTLFSLQRRDKIFLFPSCIDSSVVLDVLCPAGGE